ALSARRAPRRLLLAARRVARRLADRLAPLRDRGVRPDRDRGPTARAALVRTGGDDPLGAVERRQPVPAAPRLRAGRRVRALALRAARSGAGRRATGPRGRRRAVAARHEQPPRERRVTYASSSRHACGSAFPNGSRSPPTT